MGGVRYLRKRAGFLKRHAPRYLAEARAGDPAMPAWRRLRYVAEGFHPLEGSWYDQAGIDRGACVSNFHRETALHGLNGHRASVLDDKLLFAQALESAGVPHPTVFGHSHRGRWHWREDGRARFEESIAREVYGVVKPVFGKKGLSVARVRSVEEALAQPGSELVATAFVRQAEYAQAINPGSLNTIRLVTLDRNGGEPVLIGAVHRFGAAGTGEVDNFSAGGVVARIDPRTGVLDRAVRVGPGNRLDWLDRHPDTAEPIAGVRVEAWEEVLALTRRLGALFPFLPYVGWDLAVSRDGATVIEGNAHPSLRFFQIYAPLLDDSAAGRSLAAML
ncbi:sugar-transfer associated ATP-grasp domain-containing protein [Salinarimonas ramus]|uniref:Alpha-L-glutamate ligase-related protein ATP-grasp domain-containing protein n=1 Tax=Salinarimonas ramus TaxID=690164 RepID=A0A917V809_9HYPH|nr:sugar-transfer associated ATP-grasp domain-containing protein [Salinarimonas ramus]GGK48951.1 hypothetical protein GCM10011322_39970 [Salinarimonas ramus]